MPNKPYKFPQPIDYPAKDPIILCPADRVIKLYKQALSKDAQRVSPAVRQWFVDEAIANGWADCRFLPVVQSKHSAGCILLNPAVVKVTLKRITINLVAGQDA